MSHVLIRVVRLEGIHDGPGEVPDAERDAYLLAYDPDAHEGRGAATWTYEPEKARRFPTVMAAMECWSQQSTVRPLRPDGRPNKPLTAFSVEPVVVP